MSAPTLLATLIAKATSIGAELIAVLQQASEEELAELGLTRIKAQPEPAPQPEPPASPAEQWLTRAQAAEYTGRDPETVRLAVVAYQRDPTQGLRGHQRAPNASYRFRPSDLDRWVQGKPPARDRLTVARTKSGAA